jgi:hypothetical protein
MTSGWLDKAREYKGRIGLGELLRSETHYPQPSAVSSSLKPRADRA